MRSWITTVATFGATALILLLSMMSEGGGSICAASPVQEAAAERQVSTVRTRSVADVANYLTRVSGVRVFADSTLNGERAPLPAPGTSITAANIESHIDALVKALPEGVTWGRLYLPPTPKGKRWTGDAVVAYAAAQAELYGTAGEGGPEGTVEIISQQVPADRAAPIQATLDLHPVYFLTRRAGPATFTGTWKTTFGEMRLLQRGNRFTGTYTYQDGLIDGEVSGSTARIHWLERASGGKGSGVFQLAADGRSFSGHWNSVDDPDISGSTWEGTRTGWQ